MGDLSSKCRRGGKEKLLGGEAGYTHVRCWSIGEFFGNANNLGLSRVGVAACDEVREKVPGVVLRENRARDLQTSNIGSGEKVITLHFLDNLLAILKW